MEEVAYESMRHLFQAAQIDEFCEYYTEHSPIKVLQDAMIFSAHHQIGPATKRAILDITIDYIDPLLFVDSIDGLLNFHHELRPLDPIIQDWFENEAGYGIVANELEDDSELPLPDTRQQLLTEICTCPHGQLQRIIRYLRIYDEVAEYLDYPVMLALIERCERALRNDNLFYSLLTSSAITTFVYENMAPETGTIVVTVDSEALANGAIDLEDVLAQVNEYTGSEDASIANVLQGMAEPGLTPSPAPPSHSVYSGNSSFTWTHEHDCHNSLMRDHRAQRYRDYWHLD